MLVSAMVANPMEECGVFPGYQADRWTAHHSSLPHPQMLMQASLNGPPEPPNGGAKNSISASCVALSFRMKQSLPKGRAGRERLRKLIRKWQGTRDPSLRSYKQ